MDWIVKGQQKQAQPIPAEIRIANAVEAAGIDPADWTDEELTNWQEYDGQWEIKQAMRMEHTRRERGNKTGAETWAGKADTFNTR